MKGKTDDPMTIEQAISHCREVAARCERDNPACASQHEWIATAFERLAAFEARYHWRNCYVERPEEPGLYLGREGTVMRIVYWNGKEWDIVYGFPFDPTNWMPLPPLKGDAI